MKMALPHCCCCCWWESNVGNGAEFLLRWYAGGGVNPHRFLGMRVARSLGPRYAWSSPCYHVSWVTWRVTKVRGTMRRTGGGVVSPRPTCLGPRWAALWRNRVCRRGSRSRNPIAWADGMPTCWESHLEQRVGEWVCSKRIYFNYFSTLITDLSGYTKPRLICFLFGDLSK